MSELNLTLTAKPSTVSTGVNWTQNATILHHRRNATAAAAVAAVDVRNAPRSDDFRLETGSSMTPPWNTQAAERAEMRGGV